MDRRKEVLKIERDGNVGFLKLVICRTLKKVNDSQLGTLKHFCTIKEKVITL